MAGQNVNVRAHDGGTFNAYCAAPASGKGPGLVLIQEIFGVNKVMRDLAEGFARDGYVVVCPDLFWRQEPGIQLTDQSQAEWDRAFQLYNGFDKEKGVADLGATLDHVRAAPQCAGKVGAVGYCLGGSLAYVMACATGVDAAVGFYGVAIEQMLAMAEGIKNPLMLHIAEKDQFCPPEAQTQIRTALGKNAKVTLHTYAGVDHAFARVGGGHYDEAAATRANQRTAEFFERHLR